MLQKKANEAAKEALNTAIGQKVEVMIDDLRKNLAERYKEEGVDQPRYPVETPIYNGVARFVWLGLGTFIFGGILMLLAPAAPVMLLAVAGFTVTSIFIGAHWTKEIADKTAKMGAANIRPQSVRSEAELKAIKDQQKARVTKWKSISKGFDIAQKAVMFIGTAAIAYFMWPAGLAAVVLPVVLGFSVNFLGKWFIQMGPFMKFQFVDQVNMIKDIIKSSKSYTGDMPESLIKENTKFYKRFFATFTGLSAVIVGSTIYFAAGIIPGIGWLFAGIILILSVKQLWNSVWNMTMAAKAKTVHKEGRWATMKTLKDITPKKLEVLRNNEYLKSGFMDGLLKETLREFYLVTEEQAAAIARMMDSENPVNEFPADLSPQAKEEIVKFFNVTENLLQQYGGEEGFRYMLDNMMFEKMLPMIVKGTGKKRIVPYRRFP